MTATAPVEAELLEISVKDITAHPLNRKIFDQAELEKLADSIAGPAGQLTAAIVRPHGKGYQLIAGERRWRAKLLRALPTLRCEVRELDDAQALEFLIIENNHRNDPHPLEEAEQYKGLLEMGFDVAKIAEKLDRGASYIYDRLKLLKLGKEAKKLFLHNHVQLGHAIILARLSGADQKRVIDGNLGGRSYGQPDGLFLDEHTLFDPDTDDETEENNGYRVDQDPRKPITPRELQSLVDRYIRASLGEADPMLFPAAALALEEVKETDAKLVPITYDRQIERSAMEEGVITLTPNSWTRADGLKGSKACEHSIFGQVVAGVHRNEVFRICRAKRKCTVHWPEEVKAAKAKAKAKVEDEATGGTERVDALTNKEDVKAKAKAEARRQQIERFDKAAPALFKAAAAGAKKLSLAAAREIILKGEDVSCQSEPAKHMKSGSTAADLVAYLAYTTVMGGGLEIYSDWDYDNHIKQMKKLGVDVEAVIDEAVPLPKPIAPEKPVAKRRAGDVAAARKAKLKKKAKA